MTTHRHDEAITFVSWMHVGALHIRRPRSQKGVAYCDERAPAGTPTHSVGGLGQTRIVREFAIEHPDDIPLEIRIERDFANLCPKCARTFFNEVAEENGLLRWSGVLVSVPIAWQAIYTRTGRTLTDAEAATEALARETRNVVAGEMHPAFNPTPSAADLAADRERFPDGNPPRRQNPHWLTDGGP